MGWAAAAPAIGAGVSSLFQYLGSGQAAGASKEAAAIQAQTAQNALDFMKSVYNTKQSQLAPYLSLAGGAVPGLSALLGIPMAAAPAADPSKFSFGNVPSFPDAQAAWDKTVANPGQPVVQAPDQPIMMQAPDGSRKLIPQSLYNYYVSKGAKGVFDESAGYQFQGVTKTPNRAPTNPGPYTPLAPQTTPGPAFGG